MGLLWSDQARKDLYKGEPLSLKVHGAISNMCFKHDHEEWRSSLIEALSGDWRECKMYLGIWVTHITSCGVNLDVRNRSGSCNIKGKKWV